MSQLTCDPRLESEHFQSQSTSPRTRSRRSADIPLVESSDNISIEIDSRLAGDDCVAELSASRYVSAGQDDAGKQESALVDVDVVTQDDGPKQPRIGADDGSSADNNCVDFQCSKRRLVSLATRRQANWCSAKSRVQSLSWHAAGIVRIRSFHCAGHRACRGQANHKAPYIPLADHYAALVAYERYRDDMKHVDFQIEQMTNWDLLRAYFQSGEADMAYVMSPLAMDMHREQPHFLWVGLPANPHRLKDLSLSADYTNG